MAEGLQLSSNQHAIFGYGSLLSQKSMEATLGRAYAGAPISCGVRGWRRAWDVFVPNQGKYVDEAGIAPANIIYLNVREAAETVNGLLYVVTAGELTEFDAREWVYDRVDITGQLADVNIESGRAWIYVAKPEYLARNPIFPEFAIRQSYLDTVATGLRKLGEEFQIRYEQSTDAAPTRLVIHDRLAVSA